MLAYRAERLKALKHPTPPPPPTEALAGFNELGFGV